MDNSEITNNSVTRFNENICVICLDSQGSSENDKVISVSDKGLKTLIEFSLIRDREDLSTYLTDCLKHQKSVVVHQNCRRNFTDRKRLQNQGGNDEQSSISKRSKLRSSNQQFQWGHQSLFCGKNAINDDRHPERTDFVMAMTLHLKDRILAMCTDRSDTWGDEVKCRFENCIDLVAEEAVYHKSCYCKFFSNVSNMTLDADDLEPGRPIDQSMLNAFNEMCVWFENQTDHDTCTLDILYNKMAELASGGEVYSVKRMKQKLKEKYKDSIFFAEVKGRPNFVCLKNMASYIIGDHWYKERNENIQQESERTIATAAKLIRSGIREHKYQTDTYPDDNEIKDLNAGKSWLPDSLLLFLRYLITSEMKQISIGQCIVKASRPYSTIPPILFGLGIEMDHVFGSKWLINELHKFGFSISYTEVNRYKQSVIQTQNIHTLMPDHFPNSFTQWVGDNVDHNLATIDGCGTFHGMGVIAVSTPTGEINPIIPVDKVKRLKKIQMRSLIANHGIPIVPYQASEVRGLSKLTYKPLIELHSPYTLPSSLHIDTLWHAGWMFRDASHPRPNWSGFMQSVSEGNHPDKSDVLMLPIIDLNPNNETCIYSTLLFIQEQASKLNVVTPCITFDQPLWIKAVDIIASECLGIVCRLGGFHLLMSFLGSIRSLMEGSGISEALQTAYGSNTVSHMLTGKAISRAIRGHLLLDTALMVKLMKRICPLEVVSQNNSVPVIDQNPREDESFGDNDHDDVDPDIYDHLLEGVDEDSTYFDNVADSEMLPVPSSIPNTSDTHQLDNADIAELSILLRDIQDKNITVNEISKSEVIVKLEKHLDGLKDTLESKSRTAKLWLQYMSYIALLRLFIRAERIGNWHLHLVAVSQMLNLFAATGHNNYAKCSRLYLQMMLGLPSTHPWLYDQFMNHGFHTVRRSDRYWAGLWTDLVIEQVMMRSIKSRGGLTRGRGMSESVRLSWVYTMHKCASVHESMAELSNCAHGTRSTDQHVDLGQSRCKRDLNDVQKMVTWLNSHEPFDVGEPNLRCLSSGLTSVAGDGINCDTVEKVGGAIQKSMDNIKVSEISLKRANQVKTLVKLDKGLAIEKQVVHIDGNILFSRLIVLVQRSEDIASYFEYELTAEPMSLFKDKTMRKTNKAALATYLLSGQSTLSSPGCSCYVLDGGALLHRVRWSKKSNYADILNQYVSYVERKYGKCHIVFDGYPSSPSTKDHEHNLRSTRSSSYVRIEENMIFDSDQELILANRENKKQFMSLLIMSLTRQGVSVEQAASDADTLIVTKAIDLASQGNLVSVVADDTDILVVLLHHFRPHMADILFLSELKKKQGSKMYSIKDLFTDVGGTIAMYIPFVHAWSGCDTTSATFGHGKTNLLKKLTKSREIQEIGDVFLSQQSTKNEIMIAGAKLFVFMFGGKSSDTLNNLRYSHFMQMSAKGTVYNQAQKLPPTESAAIFHSLRVHLQVLHWTSLNEQELDPLEWGWELKDWSLCPIMTDKGAAPDDILHMVRCNCKTTSRNACGSNMCTCRKHGLQCVSACGDCHGKDCNNIPTPTFEDSENDI